jgi:hypothetical protein
VNRVGVVYCLDVTTGQIAYTERVKQGCWATPVGIGDRIYIFGKDGLTTVLKSGPEFELLAENQLWDPEKVGAESLARQRASGGNSVGHREHDSATPQSGAGAKPGDSSPASTGRPGTQVPAEGDASPRRGAGGRPASTPEDEKRMREQGDNRFADPVQYGVAIVNGSLVIRTGEVVYCLRNRESAAK